MNKQQWYNLFHVYRWMKRFVTQNEALAWIAVYNAFDASIILKITGDET